MAGSRVQVNKSHKTRFASKSSRNVHKSKIEKSERNVAKGARAARIQRNKMMREQKRAALLKEKRASSGSTSPPRVIVLFGLSALVNLNALEEDLLALLSEEGTGIVFPAVASSEYKLRTTVDFVPDDCNSETCTLLLTGYLRARNLSVDQLVHVSGAGDFQMCKIELLKDPCPLHARKGDFMDSDEVHDVQVITALNPDPLKQEPLLIENVPDPLAGEQTWPTEAEMAESDRNHRVKAEKEDSSSGHF